MVQPEDELWPIFRVGGWSMRDSGHFCQSLPHHGPKRVFLPVISKVHSYGVRLLRGQPVHRRHVGRAGATPEIKILLIPA